MFDTRGTTAAEPGRAPARPGPAAPQPPDAGWVDAGVDAADPATAADPVAAAGASGGPGEVPVFGGVPGPGLAAELADADPAVLDGYALVEAIGGWERLASWVAARQCAAVAELARRRPTRVGDPGGPQTRVGGVSEFCVDEIAPALRLSRQGASLRLELAVDLCEKLPATWEALAAGVIALPRARVVVDGTGGLSDELARRVERRVLPRAGGQTPGQLRASVARAVVACDPDAARRRHEKEKTQRKVTTQPLPDGMGQLAGYLTAVELRAAWAAVDAAARAAQTPHDGRTADQRRADALVDLLTGRNPTTTPGDGAAGAAGPGGTGTASLPPAPSARAQVQVAVAATTLLGLDEAPGELAGYGPIPAVMARQIAADATWRRILTDPATGAAIELSRRTYTPGAVLGDYIRTRDRTCRFPGCRQPASCCDIDHTVHFPDGPTAPCNLACLCRHHHRCKQTRGWRLEQTSGGRLTWTTPTGHTYTTHPAADPTAAP